MIWLWAFVDTFWIIPLPAFEVSSAAPLLASMINTELVGLLTPMIHTERIGQLYQYHQQILTLSHNSHSYLITLILIYM